MRVNIEHSKFIIVAVAVLHNIAINERDEWVMDEEKADQPEIVQNGKDNNIGKRLNLINTHFAN